MKYESTGEKIRLPDRKALNQKCLDALAGEAAPMKPVEIFNSYTGIGGLHGLDYVDFGNYHDFSEAKKEIEQGQFFTSCGFCPVATGRNAHPKGGAFSVRQFGYCHVSPAASR